MEPILTIDNLNSFGGNMLRQGDKSQLKYRLRDVGNKNLNISGKSCQVKMYGRNYTVVVYETTATVSSENTVSFTIDKVLPKGTFYLEFTVGDYIFPTDHREFFEITPSGKGMEANIIEIVGVDAVVRKAVDLINVDPSLIIDEDKLITDIISNTGIGNIEEYYQQFSDVITELSEEKDYHSLPEIAGARGGHETLGARLDDTTTQLAQKASSVDLKITDNRIDGLIANAGDGTIPSELSDIRVGADGVIYSTAGEAVRTQLEEITKGSWNLKNEVVNGDFSTSDISHVTSTTLDLEVVDNRLKASKSNWTYTSGSTIIIQNAYNSWVAGDQYYVKGSLKVIGNTQNPLRFGGYDQGIVVNVNNYRELNVVSGVISPSSKNFVIRHFLNSSEYVEIILDNFVSINLTKTFGAGNEPTNEEMDELLELLGGWFEGTAKESLVTLWKFSTSSNSGTLDSVLTTENETWEVV